MNTWINYHHLYYFHIIAREGSISQASKILKLGQPALSAQLKQLEEMLNVQLFERSHKKLNLTESGKIAYEYSAEIFKLGTEMVEALNDRLTPNRIHIQLGALDSIPKHLIFELCRRAYETSPCSISIIEGKDDELLRELLNHNIDLMLTNHVPKISDTRKIFSRKVAQIPVLMCGSIKFKKLKKGFPHSLDGQPFVLPTSHSKLRHDLEHFFKIKGIHPDIVAETQDTSLQKIIGSKGVGIIPIAEIAARGLLERGILTNLGSTEGVFEEIYLVSSVRKIENPVSSHLFKHFKIDLKR